MKTFENIKAKSPEPKEAGLRLNEPESIEVEPQGEPDKEDFRKIDIPPAEIRNLGRELEKETGISLSILERLGKIPRLRKALAIFLLASGLGFTVLKDAFAEDIGKGKEGWVQIDPRTGRPIKEKSAETKEMKEKLNEIKKEFVNFIQGLQERNIIKYQERNIIEYKEGEKKEIIEAAVEGKGRVGKYNIARTFRGYTPGAEKGKITGGDNERLEITFKDENGSDYWVGSWFGDFGGYAFNYEEREGFRKISSGELFINYGIILFREAKTGKTPEFAYIKDLSPKEIEDIMGDVNEQVEKK